MTEDNESLCDLLIGVTEENLKRLMEHARIGAEDSPIIRNMPLIGVNVLQDVSLPVLIAVLYFLQCPVFFCLSCKILYFCKSVLYFLYF